MPIKPPWDPSLLQVCQGYRYVRAPYEGEYSRVQTDSDPGMTFTDLTLEYHYIHYIDEARRLRHRLVVFEFVSLQTAIESIKRVQISPPGGSEG